MTVKWLLQVWDQEKQFNFCELWKSFNFVLQFYLVILQLTQRYFSSIISTILSDDIFQWMLGAATARCSGKWTFLKSTQYSWRLPAKFVRVKRAAPFFHSAVSLSQGQLWATDDKLASLISRAILNKTDDCVIHILLYWDASFPFARNTIIINASIKYILAIKRLDISIRVIPNTPSFTLIIYMILISSYFTLFHFKVIFFARYTYLLYLANVTFNVCFCKI